MDEITCRAIRVRGVYYSLWMFGSKVFATQRIEEVLRCTVKPDLLEKILAEAVERPSSFPSVVQSHAMIDELQRYSALLFCSVEELDDLLEFVVAEECKLRGTPKPAAAAISGFDSAWNSAVNAASLEVKMRRIDKLCEETEEEFSSLMRTDITSAKKRRLCTEIAPKIASVANTVTTYPHWHLDDDEPRAPSSGPTSIPIRVDSSLEL